MSTISVPESYGSRKLSSRDPTSPRRDDFPAAGTPGQHLRPLVGVGVLGEQVVPRDGRLAVGAGAESRLGLTLGCVGCHGHCQTSVRHITIGVVSACEGPVRPLYAGFYIIPGWVGCHAGVVAAGEGQGSHRRRRRPWSITSDDSTPPDRVSPLGSPAERLRRCRSQSAPDPPVVVRVPGLRWAGSRQSAVLIRPPGLRRRGPRRRWRPAPARGRHRRGRPARTPPGAGCSRDCRGGRGRPRGWRR